MRESAHIQNRHSLGAAATYTGVAPGALPLVGQPAAARKREDRFQNGREAGAMTPKNSRRPDLEVAWMLSLSLALLVSGFSLCIAVEAGHRLGSNPNARLFMSGAGIVAVLNAHLLMAIFSRASAWPRLLAFVLSVLSAVFVVYVHTSYFLSVQAQAGALRVADVESSNVSAAEHARAPRRGASLILAELANLKAGQARLQSRRCLEDCSRQDAHEAFLKTRIAALDAEADEVRRWQQLQERLEIRKAAAAEDPVTALLAALLGVNGGATGLVVGLLFAVMLEGTGCLCWFFVLGRDLTAGGISPAEARPPVTVVPQVTVTPEALMEASRTVMAPVTSEVSTSTVPGDLSEPATLPVGKLGPTQQVRTMLLLERIRPEIAAGRMRPTVTQIREYLGCARATAAEVRRAL